MSKRKLLSFTSKPDDGLNLSVSPRDVAENELSKADNFTFSSKGLTLRPGLVKKIELNFGKIIDVYPKTQKSVLIIKTERKGETLEERRGFFIAAEKAILFFDGEETEIIAESVTFNNGVWQKTYPKLNLQNGSFISTGGVKKESLTANGETFTVSGEQLLFVGSGCLYKICASVFFCQSGDYKANLTADVALKKVMGAVPTVSVNCKGDGSGKKTGCPNLLNTEVTQLFTTDTESLIYPLAAKGEIKGEVFVTYRDTQGSIVKLLFKDQSTVAVSGDISAFLDRHLGTLRFSSFLCDGEMIKDNLEVSFSCGSLRYGEIANCTVGKFFGERLFLSGNPDFPNRVYISSKGDFTDFPEDLVTSVGLQNEKVTAFERIFDSLVVFKENSIDTIEVTDDKTEVTEICADVGCPGKNGLIAFKNHLLWCSRGGIYTLHSTSQKNERAVICLSDKVKTAFAAFSQAEFESSSAAYLDNTCLFIIGKTGFVMNTSNFSSSADSLPILMWSMPLELTSLFVFNGTYYAADQSGKICAFADENGCDFKMPFEATFKTKAFSSDKTTRFMRIDDVMLSLFHDKAVTLNVSLYFDGERRDYKVSVNKGSEEIYLKPCFNRCKTLTVEIKRDTLCNDNFSVGEINISAADTSPCGEGG